MFNRFKTNRAIATNRGNQMPRLLEEGMRVIVGHAIRRSQEEILEKHVSEYRELLRAKIQENCNDALSATFDTVYNQHDDSTKLDVRVIMHIDGGKYEN